MLTAIPTLFHSGFEPLQDDRNARLIKVFEQALQLYRVLLESFVGVDAHLPTVLPLGRELILGIVGGFLHIGAEHFFASCKSSALCTVHLYLSRHRLTVRHDCASLRDPGRDFAHAKIGPASRAKPMLGSFR